MNKKFGKKWGKVKLLETSAVGIPMYPNAVNKSFNSLIKALTETEVGDQLNMEESPMEDEATQVDKSESEQVSEEPEAEAAPTEEVVAEEAPAEEVEKGLSKADMIDVMTKGFTAAIKASETERGLVAKQDDPVEDAKELLKGKSDGEIAIMNGLFKAPDMYGRIQ